MKKFLITYLAPASVIDDWKKTEPGKRKAAEEKMQGEWKKWKSDHAKIFVDNGADNSVHPSMGGQPCNLKP
jgi:hypothetical protein